MNYIRQRGEAMGQLPRLRVGLLFWGENRTLIHGEVFILDPQGYQYDGIVSSLVNSPEEGEQAMQSEIRAMIDEHAPEYIIFSRGRMSVQDACAELISYWSQWPEMLPGFDGRAALTLAELEVA
jgi:hypothetical protein